MKMTDITFEQVEYHQMTITKTMSTDAKSIEENGLTVERFKEIMSHQDQAGWGYNVEPMGEEPTDEEIDMFFEIVHGWSDCIDSEEDLWTDRKGGYDIDYRLIEEETE
jgi:hypothetical protein